MYPGRSLGSEQSGEQGDGQETQGLLDLLVDGFQLFLQHDGQSLHICLPAGRQQLSSKHTFSLLLIGAVQFPRERGWDGPFRSCPLPILSLWGEHRVPRGVRTEEGGLDHHDSD